MRFLCLLMIALIVILWISIYSVLRISNTRDRAVYIIYGSFLTVCLVMLIVKAISLI